MISSAQEPRAAKRTSQHDARMLRSLLIPIDLTSGSDRVVERSALLPLAEDARLTLLHVVPKRFSREAGRRAESDARKALTDAAMSIRGRLPKSVVVEQVVAVGAAVAAIAEHARSIKAEIVVMGRGGGRAFRDVFLGSTAERTIRAGKVPVLVVRLPPRARYRRPLLALDLDEAAHDVLALMLRIIPPPRPQVALVHAYDVPFQGLVYPSLSTDEVHEYRDHYRQKARHEVVRRLATALAQRKVEAPEDDGFFCKIYVRYGSPRLVIERTAKKTSADLVVLGTHAHSGAAHALLGTVAGDVLRAASCDVLVVPPTSARRTSSPVVPLMETE